MISEEKIISSVVKEIDNFLIRKQVNYSSGECEELAKKVIHAFSIATYEIYNELPEQDKQLVKENTLKLMENEIASLKFDLSQDWQQSFYAAQDTIEIQKKEIRELQSLIPSLDGQCDICGCVPATQITLCEEHRIKATDK